MLLALAGIWLLAAVLAIMAYLDDSQVLPSQILGVD
jgi:hypothetical protein